MASFSRLYLLSASTTSPTAFLYQTRTLLPICRSLPPCYQLRRKYSTERDEKRRNSDNFSTGNQKIETDFDPPKQTPTNPPARRTSYLRQRGSSTPQLKPTNSKPSKSQAASKKKGNTITRNEREAFGGLLARLKARHSALESTQEPKQDSTPDSRALDSASKAGNLTDLMTVFESILANERASTEEPKSDRKLKPNRQEQRRVDQNGLEEACDNGSQGIYLSELGFHGSDSGTGVDPIVSVSEAINMVVERESKKIESELFKAIEEGKGDSGLWEACRQRVFSMIDHVGGATTSPTGSPNSSSNRQADQHQDSAFFYGPLNIPTAVPAGPVVAKLYPRLLLLAFRMLSTHFPESQIISQFRAAIKEHSRTSAFLGTSQTLHEELMTFYWRSCNDLPAVLAFLRDMDNAGLYPSHRVRRLLREIVDQRSEAMKSHQQAGEDFFWDAPPIHQAFQELAGSGGWIETINSRKQQHYNSTIPALGM